MRKLTLTFFRYVYIIPIVVLTLLSTNNVAAQCSSGMLEGSVYDDQNLNSSNDSESGLANVLVSLFDEDNSLISQTITDFNGDFSFSGLSDGETFRIEYDYASDYQVSFQSTNSQTDIQFAEVPNCELSLGLIGDVELCAENPDIFVTCFANEVGGADGNATTIVGLNFGFNGSSSPAVYANKDETGSIWGLEYDKSAGIIYSAAFVKQNASFTSHGHDAIFATSNLNGSPSTTLLTTLSDLGVPSGTLNNTNPLDCAFGDQVGKIGLGSIALTNNGQFLYVANLFNNTIVKIDVTNPVSSTTEVISVPTSCPEEKIFALKLYNNKLYVGSTCSPMSAINVTQAEAVVQEMDLSSQTFTTVFRTDIEGRWDGAADSYATSHWLTDIDFSDEGNMLLALSDRIGHRYCNLANDSRLDQQFGDLLVAWNNGGSWTLESNGTAGAYTGVGAGNGQGPDGGEFFGDDFWITNPNYHPETSLGSIYAHPGSGEVVSAVFDPVADSYSGGLHRYKTDNGDKVSAIQLYRRDPLTNFGKASGFGNIIGACDPAAIEIGNYVWEDENGNGIQDANEAPLADIDVLLYNENCNVIGRTKTDAKGNYYFNNANVDRDGDGNMDGLIHDECYYISLDYANYNPNSYYYNYNSDYYLVTDNVNGSRVNSDYIQVDNVCSALDGNHAIKVLTADVDITDYTFDIGLKLPETFDLALIKILTSNQYVKLGDTATFEIQVYNQGEMIADEITVTDYIPAGYIFDASLNPDWAYDAVNSSAKTKLPGLLFPNASTTVDIHLVVTNAFAFEDYVNRAEISGALDFFGDPGDDIDSVPDDDNTNDNGGQVTSITDNILTGNGTDDEDDEDPARVLILDLALRKIVVGNDIVKAGDLVEFEITVFNQGFVDIEEFDVVDYLNPNFEFSSSLNPGWNLSGNILEYTYENILAQGASVNIPIRLKVNDDYLDGPLFNYAEVSSFSVGDPDGDNYDFDSTPDDDGSNDIGADPDDITDNLISDHNEIDEDDHDVALVFTSYFDLALTKSSEQKIFEIGDFVEFDIYITNQGSITANNISIVDYLPEGTRLADNNWLVSGSNATRLLNIPGGLMPYQTFHTTITIEILPTFDGVVLINYAEIASAQDNNGNDLSGADIDSSPDMSNTNDLGGTPGGAFDDFLMGTGYDDEDDHDPARLYTIEVSATDPCTCLGNATEEGNGQFSEEIIVTAPSGQVWYLAQSIGFYDIASPAPPGAPIPITTGLAGYILPEVPNGDGTSDYILQGVHIDGQGYTIQFANDDGYFHLFHADACEYDGTTIDNQGIASVCINTIADYSIEGAPGCTYTWSLPLGGGTIVGPNTGTSVQVSWEAVIGDYEIAVTPTCSVGSCYNPGSVGISVGAVDGAISCLNYVNISLGPDCETEVVPATILAGNATNMAAYGIMLLDQYGNVLNDNYVRHEHIGEDLTAKLIDGCSGNSCWANITVEDKLPPVIECDDIVVPCYAVDTYRPIHFDNCTDAYLEILEETITPLHCDDEYIKEVTRTYQATDAFGNSSEPCSQLIQVKRLDFGLIELPDDFEVEDGTELVCSDVTYDENGFPSLEMTGVPTIYGEAIYPDFDFYCNAGVTVETVLVSDDGCVKKYMRMWDIYESWCTVGVLEEHTQIIEVADFEDPVITCPAGQLHYTDGSQCSAEVKFESPTISDDCSEDLVIDITYPGGFLNNWTTESAILEPGIHPITYTVYDGCENSASCSINVEVVDATPPVAVCDEFTTVSLNSTGMAVVPAEVFDDGSYDDCYLTNFLVQRMDNGDCPCEVPSFEAFNYLGEYNEHFYYLSKTTNSAQTAERLAEAYGGYLVWLDNAEENDWVHTQVQNVAATNFLIGLSDAAHEGDFTWPGHNPATYTNWAAAEPSVNGNYVVNSVSNEWTVIDEFSGEFYYVVELTDICGWSESVKFCCEDAGAEHMVGFRAIDKSGFYNNCMVSAEIQDKVSPVVVCPDDQVLECGDFINFDDLTAQFGEATATDACGVTITHTESVDINQCNTGTIEITFTAADNVNTSSCTQTITIDHSSPFTEDNITWPLDSNLVSTCTSTELDPEFLNPAHAYPLVDEDQCDFIGINYVDEVFSFDDSGVACFKILRKWSVIDWCQVATDPDFEPWTYDQTFKINNFIDPEIVAPTIPDTFCSYDLNCEGEFLSFDFSFSDDCTPGNSLQWRYTIDTNGVFFVEDTGAGDMLSIMATFPLGDHSMIVNVEDMCGNVADTSLVFSVVNCKNPTAYCIDGLSVGLTCMDIDNDGVIDAEMAWIYPEMVDGGSFASCGQDFELSFEGQDSLLFDCGDVGTNMVTLTITDENGNVDFCIIEVEVQDNNDCLICKEFDLALTKVLNTPPPYIYGQSHLFTIEVENQGPEIAYNIEISDYIPEGYSFNAALNPLWSLTGDIATATIDGPLNPGATEDLVIILTFDAVENPDTRSWYNEAEISTFTDVDGMTFDDIDSEPDNDPDNDNDVELDSDDDNETEGDPDDPSNSDDEDDNDPAGPDVADIALIKTLAEEPTTPFGYGDMVEFEIQLFNQGNITLTDILVVDYIPCGFNFTAAADVDWDYDGSNAYTTVPGPLAPGQSTSIFIELEVTQCSEEGAYYNVSEVVEINDEDGNPEEDVDSDPDDDENNDGDPQDDEVNDPDDEDDHDPEEIEIYDLALIKTISAEGPFAPGDEVTFTITVINQGNVNAANISVVDYIPSDMSFGSGNTDFSVVPLNPSQAVASITNLNAGESIDLSITLMINSDFMGDSIENWAEIAVDDGDDADSTPDSTNGTDTESPEDDEVDNTNGDEDDHDPEEIEVEQIYDLALIKELVTTGLPQAGDDIEFNITVVNQGTLDASNIEVTDYIPTGMSLTASNTVFVLDPMDASQAITTIGTLPAGTSTVLPITLTIDADFVGSSITNWAEISMDDGDDIDSTPDDNNGMDTESPEDDELDNMNGDEDDHDPEEVVLCMVAVTASNSGPVCEGEAVTLSETGGEAVTWLWGGPNGFSSDLQNPIVNPAVAGVYSVTITNDEDCSNVSTTTVVVNPNPTPEIAEPQAVCEGDPITLTVTGSTGSTFSWSGPNDFTGTGTMITVDPAVAGDYTVTETDINGCMNIAEVTVIVNPTPAIEVADVTVCPDESAMLNETGGDAVTWSWEGPNSFTSTLQNPSLSAPVTEGDYGVTITDANGCTNEAISIVAIEDNFELTCDNVMNDTIFIDPMTGTATVDVTALFSGVTDCGDPIEVDEIIVEDITYFCNDAFKKDTISVDIVVDGDTLFCESCIYVDLVELPYSCPESNIELNCNEYLANPDTMAVIIDEDVMCFNIFEVQVDENSVLDECNVGFITYEYHIVNTITNDTMDVCDQTVIVSLDTDDLFVATDVEYPADTLLMDCVSISPDSLGFPEIIGDFDACGPITVTFEDVVVGDGDGCPDGINRVWTVTDSCQLVHAGTGQFMHTQVIMIVDETAPVLECPSDSSVFVLGPDCDLIFDNEVTVTDCTSTIDTLFVTYTDQLDVVTLDTLENGSPMDTLLGGTWEYTFISIDLCGNADTCEWTITIEGLEPEIKCEKYMLFIGPDMTVTVDSDTIGLAGLPCDNGSPITTSFSDTDPNDQTEVFDCSDIGVFEQSIYFYQDGVVFDSCLPIWEVRDPDGFCSSPFTGDIYGKIMTEIGLPVDEVGIDLLGSGMPNLMTGVDGEYAFSDMPFGDTYRVVPGKDVEAENGVSTLDLILIQKHILNQQSLNTPYKLIAADVNKSKSITVLDAIELRKLLLGEIEAFEDNTSWRLVDADYEFIHPENALQENFDEDLMVAPFDQTTQGDFIAVKVGDVNNTVIANVNGDTQQESRTENVLSININDKALQAGDLIEVPVVYYTEDLIDGYQLTIDIDESAMDVIDLSSNQANFTESNFRINEDGDVLVSWNDQDGLDIGKHELFTVTLQVYKKTWLSEVMNISSDILKAEAYKDDQVMDLEVNLFNSEITDGFILYQNSPNPWSETTSIEFFTPDVKDVMLQIRNINGQLVYGEQIQSKPGRNQIVIDKSFISGKGVYYYELITDQKRDVKKMLLIK